VPRLPSLDRFKAKTPEDRIPRGALAVVAVGLLACIAAALLIAGPGEGEAAHLEWVQQGPIPDSKPVAVPGGTQKMQLTDAEIRATGTNVAAYSLFRVSAKLRIEPEAPIGRGKILCSIEGKGSKTEIAHTGRGLRATFPRSSRDGIYKQESPEGILVSFSSHGSELAVLELEDLPRKFTNERGVKLGWPEYETGTENLLYYLPDGKKESELELPFYTVWKTVGAPAAKIACTLSTSAGKATVQTAGALAHPSPPIDEEAEEHKAEEREEAKAEAEEAEGE
jgi:hypothetical protein